MDKTSFLRVIASEKSSRLLLLLYEGPKNCHTLIRSLEVNPSEFLSDIRLLEQHYLVDKKNSIYALTPIGKIISEKLKPISSIEKLIDSNEEYLHNRKLDFIPPHLSRGLHEILSSTVIQPKLLDVFDYNRSAHETSISTKSLNLAAAGLLPTCFDALSDLISKEVKLSLIFDSCLYQKVKRDRFDELQGIIKSKQVVFYVYPKKLNLFSLKVNDSCLVLRLLTHENTYDHKHLYCNSSNAVVWGKELFEHYLKNSTPITEIEDLECGNGFEMIASDY